MKIAVNNRGRGLGRRGNHSVKSNKLYAVLCHPYPTLCESYKGHILSDPESKGNACHLGVLGGLMR